MPNRPINQDEINKLVDEFGDNPQLIQAMMAKQRFVMPEDANFWKLYDHRHEAGNGERIDMAGYLKELGYE